MHHFLPNRIYAYVVDTPLDTPNKIVLDASAMATALGSIAGYLPAISALFSVVWLGLQIYGWFEQRRERKRKLAELTIRPDKP